MNKYRFDSWVGKIPWRREWLPSPVFCPGESHGLRGLAGSSPWGHRVGDAWGTNTDNLLVVVFMLIFRSSLVGSVGVPPRGAPLCSSVPFLTLAGLWDTLDASFCCCPPTWPAWCLKPPVPGHSHESISFLFLIHFFLKKYISKEGMEKREPSYTVCGYVNWCSHYGKQNGGSLQN